MLGLFSAKKGWLLVPGFEPITLDPTIEEYKYNKKET